MIDIAAVKRAVRHDRFSVRGETVVMDDGTAPPTPAAIAAAAAALAGEPPPVPRSVTPVQARRALRQAGLLDQVDTLVATLPPEARDEWEYGLAVERDNPVIAAVAAALGLTAAQVDDLFRAAAAGAG